MSFEGSRIGEESRTSPELEEGLALSLEEKIGIKSVPRDLPLWAIEVTEDRPSEKSREQVYSLELSVFPRVLGRGKGLLSFSIFFLEVGPRFVLTKVR